MKYRLLALDIDGTLVNSKKEITPKTHEALMKLQKNGVKLAIASGRPYPGMKHFVKELELDRYGGYLLSFNSGRIIDCSDNSVVCEHAFSEKYMPVLYNFAKGNGANILSYDGDIVVSETPEDEYLRLEAGINKMEVKKISSFPDYFKAPVIKAILLGNGDLLAELEIKLNELLGNKLNIFRSEPFFLEVMPKDIDKAAGLKALEKLTGIPVNEMVACGDGYNDITMIKAAGAGVAMENARQEVKEAADFIAGSNNDDGLLIAIEKYFKD